jgi:hypothetical protein
VFGNKFDMLSACKHGCMFVGALHFLENAPVTWSTTAAWIALPAGLKQAAAFRIIAQLYSGLYQGVWGWFSGRALELELAHWGAVHPAISAMAWQ